MRVLLALGGNAMTNADGRARPEDQIAAAQVAMEAVAELLSEDVEVMITHGNGPQVGNLLVKNELAATVVPPVPLDWCGAQTQATLGFVLMDALDAALMRRGVLRRTATVVTRAVVDSDDPGFTKPTKPIGRFLPADEAQLLAGHGETGAARGEKRARRDVGGPRREGLAARGRVAGATRDPRRTGGAGVDRGWLRGRRQRRWRNRGGGRGGRLAAWRRGGHRQGPGRLPAGPVRRGGRARDRDRRTARG